MTRQALHQLGLTPMALSSLVLIIIGVLISQGSTNQPALGNHQSTSRIKGDGLPSARPANGSMRSERFPGPRAGQGAGTGEPDRGFAAVIQIHQAVRLS